jgi:hypothetical protein
MRAVRHENTIHPRLLAPLMQKEHIIHHRRAHAHHAAKPEPTHRSRAEQGAEVRRRRGPDAAQDGDEDGEQRDGTPAVGVG